MGAKRDFALIKHSHSFGDLLDIDLTGLADNSLLQYDSTSGDWQDVTVAGLNVQLDHGALLGLADNDHPQYALAVTDMIAGAGLTGGGTLAASRTFTVGAGTGITVNANDVALSAATITSLGLADTSVQPARALTAGAGLTGGGTLAADRTFDVGAGTGITVNANDVAVNQAFSPTWTGNHTFTPASGNTAITAGHFGVGTTSFTSLWSGTSTISATQGVAAGASGGVQAISKGTANATKIEMFASDASLEVGLIASGTELMSFYTGGSLRVLFPLYNAIRITATAGDPASPVNGDLWYNSSTGKFRGRAAGASVDLH